MFEAFFGLSENPFNLTPDPRYLYLSETHQEALSHLVYGIEQRKGFVLITGEVGAGKTTLCRSLLASLTEETRTALILYPSLSAVELLQTINQEFGIAAQHTSKKALLDELNAFLFEVRARGENAVLIIDECQNLPPEVLEQIRMLSNLETEQEKLLQILMIGQPELGEMLQAPGLRQINDRIVLRYHLVALDRRNTARYLIHRLTVAGSHGDIQFSRRAIRRIHAFSAGLPRRINAVAERAMLIAYLKGSRRITGAMVSTAISELQGEYGRHTAAWKKVSVACGVCAALILLAVPFLPAELRPWQSDARIAESATVMPGPVDTEPVPESEPAAVSASEHEVPDLSSWVVTEYDEALELLSRLPGGIAGPDILNLHPAPERLGTLGAPCIASVNGGYAVVAHATAEYVRIVGQGGVVMEMLLQEFQPVYRWNVILTCTRAHDDEIFRLEDEGDEVGDIQAILAHQGFMQGEPDGLYTLETFHGVERLQEAYGLGRDGIVGPDTLELLRILGNNDNELDL